jgi:addiction module HigA family antidote
MNDFERKQVWELLHKAERAGNSAEALGYNTGNLQTSVRCNQRTRRSQEGHGKGRMKWHDERPARRDPKRVPTHPGEILREEVLPALDMGVTEAAAALMVSRQTLHRILAGKVAISPEMALRLGKFCGNGPGIWLRMQQALDLWHARKAIADDLSRIRTARAA